MGTKRLDLMACVWKCWKYMRHDFFQLMQEFYTTNKLVNGLISSFISLIPTKISPSGLADYRPISLMGVA